MHGHKICTDKCILLYFTDLTKLLYMHIVAEETVASFFIMGARVSNCLYWTVS